MSNVSYLQKVISAEDAEIDTLRRRIAVLEADRNICGQTQSLNPECRIWLVMNDMLKAKYRVRRDGR